MQRRFVCQGIGYITKFGFPPVGNAGDTQEIPSRGRQGGQTIAYLTQWIYTDHMIQQGSRLLYAGCKLSKYLLKASSLLSSVWYSQMWLQSLSSQFMYTVLQLGFCLRTKNVLGTSRAIS